jgi:tetratricopeptide (TPR) repeat protein
VIPGVPARPPRASHHAVIALLLCTVTLAIYSPVRNHEFIEYDDPIYITENPNLAASLNSETFKRAFTEPYETNWIPLTWLSFHLDRALFGLEPGGTQLVNAVLHTISAVLLYFALFAMTGALPASAFVAAVFAVHPTHVESVAWAAERKDTLSGLFWMLTLLAYAHYARSRRPIAGMAAVVIAFGLGLLAKPMLVSLPLVLLALDYWPLRRLAEGERAVAPGRVVRRVAEKLPMFALAAVVAWITLAVQDEAGAMATDAQVPIPLRIANALTTLWIYIGDSVWPSGLAIFYPHPMAATSHWLVVLAAVGLILVTSACLVAARTRPYLIVGWSWYLVTLLPVIGLVQVGMQARADRYLYIPQIGLTLALAWGAKDVVARSRRQRVALTVAACLALTALSWTAWRQVGTWRDTATLYAHAIDVTEDNFLAHHGLAVELLAAGELAAAEQHFARAVAIKPKWPSAHLGLGDARFEQGWVGESLRDYRRAVELAPRRPEAHSHLARALAASGMAAPAEHHFRRAIELFDEPDAATHAHFAAFLARSSRLGPAERQYRRAIGLDPEFGEAHANLAFVLIRAARYPEARTSLARAGQLGQNSAELDFALGVVALEHAEPADAVRHYRAALAKRPGWSAPANNLAWLLATHADPNVREPLAAVAAAERLRHVGEQLNPDALDTLAAAYAAAGRFQEAVRTATVAEQIARDAGRIDFAHEIEARLQLYRTGRPFIAPAH